jgi:hypothetical protein
MASAIEQELLKATKFKMPKEGYSERQDYLAALARAGYKLDTPTYDDLTDPAADWVNDGVKSLNQRHELLEFPDWVEDEPEAEAENQDEADAEDAEDEAASVVVDKSSTVPRKKMGRPPAPKPDKAGPRKRKTKPHPTEAATVKTRYDHLTGEKDKWDLIKGTKVSDAVAMYERGTTSAELKEVLGGRFYNVLKKLQKDGHLVERTPEGIFKVTHITDRLKEQEAKSKKGKK